MVVGGEERAASDHIMQVLCDGPGDGQSIKGGGAAADFIEDDKRSIRGVVENEGCFAHLHHEGGLAA